MLRLGGEGLCISSFNRDVCLRLLDDDRSGNSYDCSDSCCESADSSPVPRAKIEKLEAELRDYLNEYMQDRPEGHKWIIIACLYLTFAEHLPMHPQQAAKWVEKDGRYYCPSMVPQSITCSCCMCESMDMLR